MGGRKKSARKPYLAGLDGLRAIAVAAVVLYHLFPATLRGGFIGVDVFFVISGFLITSLLIFEHAETGRISLKQFWTRRARRLLPALIATITVTCSVALLIGGDILVGLGRQVLGAATFSNNWVEVLSGTNYFDASSLHIFTNFWSLAVEEQFYAVWPFILVGILSITVATRRYRVGLWASVTLATASAALMFLLFDEQSITRVYYGSDTHAFGLMLGAALAFWGNARYANASARGDKWPSARFKRPQILQGVGWMALVGIGTLAVLLPELEAITYRSGLVLASLLAGAVVLAAVSRKGNLQRLLEIRWLKWIGVRSYGIYLWHWPLIVLCHYGLPQQAEWMTPFIVVTASIIAAALSYRFLEQPIRTIGISAYLSHHLKREITIKDRRLIAPRPLVPVFVAAITMTALAIAFAPTKTQAQQQVEAGQALIAKQNHIAKAKVAAHKARPITGSDITLVGDSVSLASAPELQSKFPGIYIDAVVSRSIRRGGLETIERLLAKKQLRRVLVVALGTNGYFGDGTIARLLKEVGNDRDVIFVTAHAPVVWVPANNADVRLITKQHHNVYLADWDKAISVHPELLGPDGIHPGPTGGSLYANSIAAAIAKIKAAQSGR